jgi:DNA-binding FadR family transcriptional regulator
MGPVHRSAASLRIAGDDLVPAEISRLLGCEPTAARSKGERLIHPQTGAARMATSGMWHLKAAQRSPEDLDAQINEMLSRLTGDLEIWRDLATRYDVDLFCGLFLAQWNEGLTLSASSLAALGLRHIKLALDIYSAEDEIL